MDSKFWRGFTSELTKLAVDGKLSPNWQGSGLSGQGSRVVKSMGSEVSRNSIVTSDTLSNAAGDHVLNTARTPGGKEFVQTGSVGAMGATKRVPAGTMPLHSMFDGKNIRSRGDLTTKRMK